MPTPRPVSVPRDDEGAILVLTLAFLLLFGLFIAALLGQVGANFKTTEVVRGRDVKNLNADGGIEYGVMRLRQDATLCPDASAGTQPITTALPVNGTALVTVSCQTLSGSATGVSGYAAILRHSTGSPLDTMNGQEKTIEGGLWAGAGLALAKPLIVNSGDVTVHSTASCPAAPSNLVPLTPPYSYGCTPAAPPDPPHILPAKPDSPPAPLTFGNCKVFKPGTYTTAPVLKNQNYFTSGTYVFQNIGDWQTNRKDIYGGAQAPKVDPDDPGEKVEVTSGAPCKSDADAAVAAGDNGTGVEFIFEGDSTLDVGSQGLLELFSRRAAAPDGTPGISLYAVPAGVPGWTPWFSSLGKPVLNVAGGTSPQVVIHGSIYAPSAPVALFATNSSSAVLLNGIVADTLALKSAASAGNLAISNKVGRGSRTILIVATAPGGSPSERPTLATALVQVRNDATRTITVTSRRVL